MCEILCSKSHEFVYIKENFCYIGITDVLINKLKEQSCGKDEMPHDCETKLDITFPNLNEQYSKGEIFGFINANFFATELFMPVSGTIIEINTAIKNNPSLLQKNKLSDCWLVKISSEFYNQDKTDLICYNEYKEKAS